MAEARPALVALKEVRGTARFRRAVASALTRVGDESGIPLLIDFFAHTSGMEAWERHKAGEALNAIVGERIYLGTSGGPGSRPSGNYSEAVLRFRKWYAENEGRLEFDASTGRWSAPR